MYPRNIVLLWTKVQIWNRQLTTPISGHQSIKSITLVNARIFKSLINYINLHGWETHLKKLKPIRVATHTDHTRLFTNSWYLESDEHKHKQKASVTSSNTDCAPCPTNNDKCLRISDHHQRQCKAWCIKASVGAGCFNLNAGHIIILVRVT